MLNDNIQIKLRQMVAAIESAVSLVGMNDVNHGKRVAYIALQMANSLGFSEGDKDLVYNLGLLHDCGVSSDTVHSYLANLFDWEHSQVHCQIGYDLLKSFTPLKKLAVPILHHHTHWDELCEMDVSLHDRRLANLIFVADRVDITAAHFYGPNILLHTEQIRKTILDNKGVYFNPEFVEAFLEVSYPEAFWLSLEQRHIERFVWDMSRDGNAELLGLEDLRQLAKIFAYIVDQKSPFTVQHSYAVAMLARRIAELCGLPEVEVDKIEVAGYLHDIGKLHVPDNILEKKGPLSPSERAYINQHSYETYEILRRVEGLHEIAIWAAYHHETCLGTGYPFHPCKESLPFPARIVAVADVFQALVQDRPYRDGMDLEEVLSILNEMADEGSLDNEIVRIVNENAATCFEAARKEFEITDLLDEEVN